MLPKGDSKFGTTRNTLSKSNTLCYFSLPDCKTRQVGNNNEGNAESVLVMSVFCNLGIYSNRGTLALTELKGYFESSEFSSTVPGLARAQSHAVAELEVESQFPTMVRGVSAIESGQSVSMRELVELSLQEVKHEHLTLHSHNFFLPLHDFYFDGTFEVCGTFVWSCADSDVADQTFHFTFQLPNSRHKHFSQVAFGSIVTADTTVETIMRGLLTCLQPLVSEMMQIRPLGRTYSYSDVMWVIRAMFTYFQCPSAVFPTLLQVDALRALAGHMTDLPKGQPTHTPLFLASIGILVDLLLPERGVRDGRDTGGVDASFQNSISVLCAMTDNFFQPANSELLKQLCDLHSSEGGKGKKIFFDSDHFFDYFRSLRQGLLFLLTADTNGASTSSSVYCQYVALRSVVPLLIKSNMANIKMAELYRAESEVLVKANINRLETVMTEDLWAKLRKAAYVSGVSGYPSTMHVSSMPRAKELLDLMTSVKFPPINEDNLGEVLAKEISKIQQNQEVAKSIRDIEIISLDSPAMIRQIKVIPAALVNMRRHLDDFAMFYDTYITQCIGRASFSNFWSLEEFRAGVKCASSSDKTGLMFLWTGGDISKSQSKGTALASIPLDEFSMKQPWALACNIVQHQGGEAQASVFVTGVNSALSLLQANEARTIVDNGPGVLLGTLDVAQLRGAKSICTYTFRHRGADVTLLVIADSGNNSLKALVLAGGDSSSTTLSTMDTEESFPQGIIILLAKIANPSSVCVFQNQLVVACPSEHMLYSVTFGKREATKSSKAVQSTSGWIVAPLAGKHSQKGAADGAVTGPARLFNPAIVSASDNKLFFAELRMGSSQAIRQYDPASDTVKTLHIGDPFKNVTGLCCASIDELYICDRGNNCVWSFNTTTGSTRVLISEADVPTRSLCSSSSDAKFPHGELPSFRPGCIVKAADGSFIVSDLSRNQIFRYLDHETVCKEVNEATLAGIFTHCDEAVRQLETTLSHCLTSIREGLGEFKVSVGCLFHKRKLILSQNYIAEVNRIRGLMRLNPTCLQVETVMGMILNAPSIAALSSFLKLIDGHPNIHYIAKEAVAKFVKEFDFSSHDFVDNTELVSLGEIFRYSKDSIAGQDLMCVILKDDSFRFDVTPAVLTMLGGLLQRLNWTMDRQKVSDLRREVVRWLSRCLPAEALLGWVDSTHEQVLLGALRGWSSIIQQFCDENNYVKKVLSWVVRVHLDSLCMGFVTTLLTARAERGPIFSLYSQHPEQAIPSVQQNQDLSDSNLPKNIDRALLTIRSLPFLFEEAAGFNIPYDLLMIFGETVSDVARTLHVETAVEALLHSSLVWGATMSTDLEGSSLRKVHFKGKDFCPFSVVFQRVLYDIMSKQYLLLESKVSEKMMVQYNKVKNNPKIPAEYVMELENNVKHPPNWEFQVEAIVFEPYLWSHLLHWFHSDFFQSTRADTPWLSDLVRYKGKLTILFSELSVNVCRGHVSTDTLRKIHAHGASLLPGFAAVGSALGDSGYMKSLETEFQDALGEIETLGKVLAVISPPECIHQSNVYTISNAWTSLTLNSIRSVLRLALPPDHDEHSASFLEFYGVEYQEKIRTFEAVPQLLLQSLSWLYTCTNLVDLFGHVWQLHNGDCEVTDDALLKVSVVWKNLLASLWDGSVSCETLYSFYRFLSSPQELMILLRTGHDEVEVDSWSVLAENNTEVLARKDKIMTNLKQWHKIKVFTTAATQQFLSEVLRLSVHFLSSTAEFALDSWRINYELLCSSIAKIGKPWSVLSMSEVLQFVDLSSPLNESILNVSIPLLSALADNEKLNIFLRSVVNDNAFSSALEIAMGLTEMECPSEIWDSASNRVNEKYMSMLRNIRSYLYNYFYEYPIKLQTFDSFVFLFGGLNASMRPEVIAQNICDCGVVRLALMDIVNFTSEGASSNRLMKIYEPSMKSVWNCATMSTFSDCGGVSCEASRIMNDEHDLFLEYHEVNRVEETINVKSYGLNELLDFQSNVVLSKSSDLMSEDYLQTIIDRFLHQFCWIRRLRESLMHLHAIGHFDFYPEYNVQYSVSLDDSSFIETVGATDAKANVWIQQVNNLRERFYFLNFYEMKNVRKFLHLLMSLPTDSHFDDISKSIKLALSDLFCYVNIEYANDAMFLQSSAVDVLRMWESIKLSRGVKCAISDYLEDICGLLHHLCERIPGRSRPAIFDNDISQHFTLPPLRPGLIYTTKASTPHGEYSQALTLFGSLHIFPEWETCLLCSEHSTEEQVCNFFRRWQRSHFHRPVNRVFCLLEVQKLTYAIQDAVIVLLRNVNMSMLPCASDACGASSKPCPLVISCLSGRYQCPLASQFHQNSLSIQPCPNSVLSQMFKHVSNSVEVHHSLSPGAGKTFNIRTKAAQEGRQCVFVPINNASTSASDRSGLVKRLRTAIDVNGDNAKTPMLLHLDISSSVSTSLLPVLFEVCVLGLSQDYSGENIFWCPPDTLVCLELACGLLEKKLQHCGIYPSASALANRETFLFDEKTLRVGMGDDFESPLYDGTIEDEVCKSNAFSRLRYVCVALSVLEVCHGTFPFQFEVKPPESCQPIVDMEDGVSLKDNAEKEAALLARDLGKTLVIKEKTAELKAQDSTLENSALAGSFLNGPRAFDLLFNAIGKKYHNSSTHLFRQHDHMSLWCLWNFVNVLYWQLQEMHHVESPLNGVCMPDKEQQLRSVADDIRAKRKIKGEIIQFMIKTAREFAIRQTVATQVTERVITHCKIEGMSRGMFNNTWIRTSFDNDGQPCFMLNRGEFYLYYRSLANCWVIDDIIESTGATYCYSKNGNIDSAWTVSPSWQVARTITASISTDSSRSSAYRGEVVHISGCRSVASEASASFIDDGIYLRQPPYDDINKYPHYIKDKDHPTNRRHLFLASCRVYVVAPQCNEDQGFFIKSNSTSIDSRMVWELIPPDQVENKVKATFIYTAGPEEEWGASESKGGEEGKTTGHTEEKADGHAGNNNYELELLRWQDSNHECILFNNSAHTVAFLSSKAGKLISQLHPLLVNHLNENRISIEGGTGDKGESESGNSHCWQLLAALTNIYKTDEQRKSILGGSYCLTGDALLKILAIQYRIRCGIPVVLLGECGCGKTMLLRFICAWLDVKLMCLDVHGGTTEEDIVDIFTSASEALTSPTDGSKPGGTLYIFLDEINTCSHMGIITEAISHRSINGVRIHEGIRVLAALNPYRQRSTSCFTEVTSGLHQAKTLSDKPLDSSVHDMSNLVYKVHPIPDTLKDFIFDFGALNEETESLYINRMVEKKAKMSVSGTEREIVSYLISRSQSFLREREGDPSVVSLRDVQRCIDLLNWFYFHVGNSGGGKAKVSALCRCCVLAIAHVYAYRLPTTADRYSFWLKISSIVKSYGRDAEKVNFLGLSTHGLPQRIIDNMQRRFVNNLAIDGDVSMNQALTENLFVTIVCLLNKIPIFIVGKPGTSKTLCIQIVASNLQGAQSVKPLWRNFPAVHFFQYQCSPMSTAESILFQYEAAKSYQEHSQDVLTALLLDEVGLAENSPDMPLKVLHYMLIDPPIAIIGLSNWVLDSSKMNRAVCLQRPDPSKEDIILTGKNIIGGADASSATPDELELPTLVRQSSRSSSLLSKLQPFLVNLARAFHILYSNQQQYFSGSNRRDFIGMRDYYSLLKFVKEGNRTEDVFDPIHGPSLLTEAVSRNFGGQPVSLPGVLDVFFGQCFDGLHSGATRAVHRAPPPPPVLKMIVDNLASTTSRHVMILSSNDIALQLILGYGIIPRSGVNVLIGSHFKDDLQELHLIQQINQVKNAMAMGTVVALLNNDSMFESLYDVLNQRYVYKQDLETGKDNKMLRLALGPRSQLCPVKEGFKLIVFVDQQKAYDTLDLPLLNRFEKQVLFSKNFLDEKGLIILEQLQLWCDRICSDSKLKSLSDIFCGYYAGTLSSLLVLLTDYGRKKIVSNGQEIETGANPVIEMDDLFQQAKQKLLLISYPTAVLKSKLLRDEEAQLLDVMKTIRSTRDSEEGEQREGQGRVKGDADTSEDKYASCLSEHRTSLCALLSVTLFATNQTIEASDISEKMLLLTTKSPLPHFYLCCDIFDSCGFASKTSNRDCSAKLSRLRTSVLQLALMNSEQKLIDEVRRFYQLDQDGAEVLFLLCDPMYCPDEVISHSRLLCVNEWQTFHDKNSHLAIPLRRNIVFVIHLPPGIKERQRQFIVEFHAPWNYSFIDDLRSSGDIDGMGLRDMISQSCFSIYSQHVFRPKLVEIIQGSFQTALAWRAASDFSNSQISYVKVMKDLLAIEEFLDFIVSHVLACLEMNASCDDNEGGAMFFHVEVACDEYDNIGGSFRDALLSSMEHLVLQAMAHVIRTIDQDFNILTLHQHYLPVLSLWISTANHFHTRSHISKSCKLVTPSRINDIDKHVFNSGLHGLLCGQFPFSHKLFTLLSEMSVKKRVEGLTIHHCQSAYRDSLQFLTSFLESIAGKCVVDSSESFIRQHPGGFLSDFVAFSISPAHGLSFASHVAIFTRLIDVYNITSNMELTPEQLYSPASVLSFFWMHEVMINHLFAVLSSQHEVLSSAACGYESFLEDDSLSAYLLQELVYPSSTSSFDPSINSLDFLVPLHVMRYLTEKLKSALSMKNSSCITIDIWLTLMRKVTGDVRMLLQLLLSHVSVDKQSELVDQLYSRPTASVDCCPEIKSLSSVLHLWWSLAASVGIVKQFSVALTSFDHETPLDLLERFSDALCSDPSVWSPFSGGSVIDLLVKICLDIDPMRMPIASVVGQHIESFVRIERDFIAACIQQRPFFMQGSFLHKASDVLLSTSQSLLSTGVKKSKTQSMVNYFDDDDDKSAADADMASKAATKASLDVNRLRRVVVKLIKDDAIRASKFITNTVDNLESDVQRARAVLLCLGEVCNVNKYRESSSFPFFVSTIQVLSMLIEDENTLGGADSEILMSAISQVDEFDKSSDLAFDMLAIDPLAIISALADTRRTLLQLSKHVLEGGIEKSPSLFTQVGVSDDKVAVAAFASQCDMANIFFLKHLRTLGGNDALLDYMRLEAPPVSFLPISKRIAGNKKIQMTNSFLTMHGSKCFIEAVEAFGLMTSSFASFEKWCYSGSEGLNNCQRLGLVLAVFYYKFDTLTVDIHLFKRFVVKLSNGNHQGLYYGILDWISELPKSSLPSKREMILEEIRVHAVILAVENPDHFFLKILSDPAVLKDMYLPSMPRSDLEEVLAAYGSSVGWYKCPNGHLYTVGACTYPMEDRICTAEGCNARIGGANHVIDSKNKRLEISDQAFQGTPGYHMSVSNSDSSSEKLCLSDRMLRLVIHALMIASVEIKYSQAITGNKNISKVMSKSRTAGMYLEDMCELYSQDFMKIRTFTAFTEDDTSMGVHLVLAKWCLYLKRRDIEVNAVMDTNARRAEYERCFEREACSLVFGKSNSLAYIQKQKEAFDMTDDTLLLVDAFGEANWLQILESPRVLNSELAWLRQSLWQIREPVSFDMFTRFFRMNSSLALQYPVLDVVLQNEASLELVKHIGDILAWHNFLFANVPSETTREQAASIKNIDVIHSLSDSTKQAEGHRILTAYCTAFNASFHLVEYLYECNPNPFLTEEKTVDLTGSGGKSISKRVEDVGMTAQTTINFSLPSASHGETDATGLCTIKLLSSLEEAHNTVTMTLHKARSAARISQRALEAEADQSAGARRFRTRHQAEKVMLRPGVTPAEQRLRGELVLHTGGKTLVEDLKNDHGVGADTHEEQKEEIRGGGGGGGGGGGEGGEGGEGGKVGRLTVPTTHHGTPANIIARRLIHYKRETFLLPLIAAAANQSMVFGCGGRIQGFDFESIESELMERLLATSSPLALQCAQFSYAGEIRKSGGLRRLGTKIPQRNLSESLLEQILTEIDTQKRLTTLIRILEDCISFINQMPAASVKSTSSGSGAGGSTEPGASTDAGAGMLLELYVLNTLLLQPSKWDEIKCPTIVQHVHLTHLQSLFLALESERDASKEGGGGPLDKVALKYREPLTPALLSTVRGAIVLGDIDAGVFIPLLREFASEQLCTDGWPADASLKEYMGYSAEIDLEALAWFNDPRILPDELELRHAYGLYHLFFE